jgi:hypothetical protein
LFLQDDGGPGTNARLGGILSSPFHIGTCASVDPFAPSIFTGAETSGVLLIVDQLPAPYAAPFPRHYLLTIQIL